MFIPNPENKKCINHKNSIRYDNRIINLEWATYSGNNKHAFDYGYNYPKKTMLGKIGKLSKSSKPVIQYDLNWNKIKEWDSQACVQRELNICQKKISYACIPCAC